MGRMKWNISKRRPNDPGGDELDLGLTNGSIFGAFYLKVLAVVNNLSVM